MVHAIRFHEVGPPHVMMWETVDVPAPGVGEVLLKHRTVGLNYIDIYHRSGLYPLPSFPATPGLEGAGTIEAIGPEVTDLAIGDRVAYAAPPIGAYAEKRVMPAVKLIKLPDDIDDQTAAAMMLQGMTVHYLIRRTYRVDKGQTVLFHAAAGGVGLIACQWLNHLGATVIGTVGSAEKATLAKANGCHHTILYREENIVDQVRDLTDGAGVPVVYDSVGRDTWDASLDCLAPLGMMVSFGNASGAVTDFNPAILSAKGSLFLTRPTLMNYIAKRSDMVAMAAELFAVVRSGAVKIFVNQTYPLREAVQAHRDLEARKTTGSTVFIV